jgi:hypothetical protein
MVKLGIVYSCFYPHDINHTFHLRIFHDKPTTRLGIFPQILWFFNSHGNSPWIWSYIRCRNAPREPYGPPVDRAPRHCSAWPRVTAPWYPWPHQGCPPVVEPAKSPREKWDGFKTKNMGIFYMFFIWFYFFKKDFICFFLNIYIITHMYIWFNMMIILLLILFN